MNKKKKNIITAIVLVLFMIFLFALTFYNIGIYNRDNLMTVNKRNLTPIVLVSIFFLMLALSFAAVPLYDLFCRVTGFGGTTQNASNKEIPKIIINQDYKMRFDTNVHSTSGWRFYPEQNTLDLKPGEVHTVKFNVENPIKKPHLVRHLLMCLHPRLVNT